MGLLDLTTDLKSLRYGRDRVGGGSSKEPFVTDSINSTPGDTGGADFLLRANTLSRVGDDLSRMGQFMISPKGLQFAVKQNLLSRSAVRSQASNGPINDGVYLPTSTLAQVATNPFGGHLLKQGINPLADTTADGSNTGISFLDNILNTALPLSAPFYAKKIKTIREVDNNRLTNLVDYKLGTRRILSSYSQQSNSFLDQITSGAGNLLGNIGGGLLNNILAKSPSAGQKYNSISLNQGEILRYDGGPGSALGIGQTSLKRVINTQDYKTPGSYLLNYSAIISKTGDGVYSTATPKGKTMIDFRSTLIGTQKQGVNKDVLSTSLDYTNPLETLGGRVNMGSPGRKGRNLINYNIGVQEGGKPTGPLDKINALPLYSSPQMINQTSVINDLVKFRIGILDNNSDANNKTYIHFRSFIDSFSDNYSANWTSQQFMGRGEKFHRYGGFDRTISMAWTVAAMSIDELIPMYQKLNYLASSLAPDYSSDGYMQGNIAYLTMGGYCYEQPGIITSMNISPMKESPYEIDIPSKSGANDGGKKTKELAMYVNVTGFNFIPLHNFVPRIQNNTFSGASIEGGGGNYISKFGKERFIALQNAGGNNYTQNNFTRPAPTTEETPDNPQINNTGKSQGINTSTT
jgi:hypothetical protein